MAPPLPPKNLMVVSPFIQGVLDLRWDDPALLSNNSDRVVVGVNVYRSDSSDRGPYRRVNSYPVGSTFFRDFTDITLVSSEIIPWDGWQSRGDAPNLARWTFQTLLPIYKHGSNGVYANSPSDVLVTVNGVPARVLSVFGPTGEVTLDSTGAIDPRNVRYSVSPLPSGPEDVVAVTYYTLRNLVSPGVDKRSFYRVTTVAVDSTQPGNLSESRLQDTAPSSDMQIEQLDYIWREAIRRNRWILEQGGERVKLFTMKTNGMPCLCTLQVDPKSREYGKQPSNRCHVCFVPGTEVTMADFTRKPIELVQVGDEVLTHKGRVRRVYETMDRDVCEDVVTIEATQGVGFTSTRNHPVLIVTRKDALTARKSGFQAPATWVEAGDIKDGDYLVFPTDPDVHSEELTRDRLRFLGYYAAEGWTSKRYDEGPDSNTRSENDKRVKFGFHTKEASTYVEELRGIVDREFGAKLCYHECSSGPNGIQVTVSSMAPVPVALEHVGRYSKFKRLSDCLVWQPMNSALEFMGAYFNGDGWECHNPSRTHLGVATASVHMARQVEGMLLRCGAVPRFGQRTRTIPNPGRPGVHDTTEHTVAIRKNDIHLLAGYMDLDLSNFQVRKTGGWAFRSGTLVLYPVKRVTRTHYHGPVYNLEVDEDHTYIAGGATVHNCYGVGFVGGYEGGYDIIVAPDDAEKRISQTSTGRRKEHSYEVWMSFSPIVSQRDFILKQNNDRYSIGPVRCPTNRGNIMQQHFNIQYLDSHDIRYQVPIDMEAASPNLPWPQTRYTYSPLRETYDARTDPAWPVTPDAILPLATNKRNEPEELEERSRTGAGGNILY